MNCKISKSTSGWEASIVVGGVQIVFKGSDKKALLADIKKELDTCDLANELADNCREEGGTISNAQDIYKETIDKVVELYKTVEAFGGSSV